MQTKFLAGMILCPVTLFALLLAGCGSGNPVRSSTPANPNSPSNPTPTPAPSPTPSPAPNQPASSFSVTAIIPASGATQVPLNAAIQIAFSAAASTSTVNANNIRVTNPKPVNGAVAYDSGNNTATFTPTAALAPSTTYTVTVSGVTSASGTAMANAYTSTFTTSAPSPSPAPAPTPAPAPASGSAVQYQAPLISEGPGDLHGQVSIDTGGNMTIQLTGASASSTYAVQFCTAVDINANNQTSCFGVGNISTDANGNGSLSEIFPRSGSWAGDFQIDLGTRTEYSTNLVPGLNGETYMSTLQPANTVNGVGLGGKTPSGTPATQAPLISGSVTYANGSATYTVTGTSPNAGFYANESETVYVDSSGTYETDTFTTDAKGDATSSSTSFGPGGDLFQVGPNNSGDSGFIGGFSIP